MASDPRVLAALAALAGPAAAFRAALTAGVSRAKALTAHDGADRAQAELGEFARGRLDRSAFAAITARTAIDGVARARIERAIAVLHAVSTPDDNAFVVEVPTAGDVRREVALRLGRLGCAFGAMRALDTARNGGFDAARPDELLDLWPFEYWTKRERQVAPPLVIAIDGRDLNAPALSDFLDGTMRIVLVVRGLSPPAPLARLITPGVLVVQSDGKGLDRVAKSSGPAIAALLEGDAAHFVHDPAAGHATWQRVTISRRPGAEPKARVGSWSAWQQRDELQHLESLAQQPSLPEGTVVGAVGGSAADATERLTNWLLEQTALEVTPSE